ncbi:N-acetylornithine carbamoyltransferase [Algivirga pacifica]|uniref:N-succinylornithine carbamoyltransferase n=1 Tax=Algivirga pacifica TaxID=1162670 RepID=A0ABP9DAJ2_9BACT
MKQFTAVHDVTDIDALVKDALACKETPFAWHELGKYKTLGLLFFNPSLRTRMSTQKAAYHLGMNVMVLNVDKDGWKIETEEGVIMNSDKAEHLKEAAAVMSQYCDVLGIRSFPELKDKEEDLKDQVLNDFLKYTTVPVISLESATRHPLQSLADVVTIEENKKVARPKVVLTWAPHPRALPQAVPNSFAEWMNAIDVDFVIACPEGYELDEQFAGNAVVTHNQEEALKDADFVYAKNWSSTTEYGKCVVQDSSWMIDNQKMSLTNEGKFMHCLPVRRNVVVADEVLDGEHSLVIEQANNRTFAAQAVLKNILKGKR